MARYARKTVSVPTVVAPSSTSTEPRHSTRPVQIATARPTTGESSDDTRRAFSQAVTVSLLADTSCRSSKSWRSKACTTSIPSSPCCSVEVRSAWRWRTSRVAFLISPLTRNTNTARNGITVSAIRAKSHRSTNITMIIPKIVNVSVIRFSVDTDAKL